ncbi:MAG: tetratricopeptide repeat protein, partial [Candidatus Sulfotelmatobacter sp.]
MGASRVFAGCLLLLMVGLCSGAQDAGAPSGQSSSKPQGHRSEHHIQVEDEDSPAQPAELTEAESAIEKRDYAAAEPLLRKLLDRQPASYVGWFDLGFVENELGRLDDSIAAYRKSVAAKPDVFESNLNLGLQLAKTGQPEAEQFLRAATQLKPTAHVAEGQYRAWLSLGETIEKSKPEEALAAYQRAAALQPK